MNILAKVCKVEDSCLQTMKSQTLVLTCLVYYANEESPDLAKQCLLTFHLLCGRGEDFKKVCLETHKFQQKSFDSFVKQSIAKYEATSKAQQWDLYVNVCASITAFLRAFPERLPEYKCLIVPLIRVMSDKTDLVRKNAAVLLARLATDEDNARIMRANHGTEVLLSLQKQLT